MLLYIVFWSVFFFPRSLILDRFNFQMPFVCIFADSLSSPQQLLDSCLKSSLLPAYLAAAFAKKLSRLSLTVPPSGSLVIIAIIHNLLRRHPSINCLVHQVTLPSFTNCLHHCMSKLSLNALAYLLKIDM